MIYSLYLSLAIPQLFSFLSKYIYLSTFFDWNIPSQPFKFLVLFLGSRVPFAISSFLFFGFILFLVDGFWPWFPLYYRAFPLTQFIFLLLSFAISGTRKRTVLEAYAHARIKNLEAIDDGCLRCQWFFPLPPKKLSNCNLLWLYIWKIIFHYYVLGSFYILKKKIPGCLYTDFTVYLHIYICYICFAT